MIKPTGSILLEWSISFKCAPGKLKEKISNTDIFLGKKNNVTLQKPQSLLEKILKENSWAEVAEPFRSSLMLQCLLILNGLSVLPIEILFEEFYNKAIKNHFGIKWKYKASSCVCFFLFLKYAFRRTFFNDFKCCSEMGGKKKRQVPIWISILAILRRLHLKRLVCQLTST